MDGTLDERLLNMLNFGSRAVYRNGGKLDQSLGLAVAAFYTGLAPIIWGQDTGSKCSTKLAESERGVWLSRKRYS